MTNVFTCVTWVTYRAIFTQTSLKGPFAKVWREKEEPWQIYHPQSLCSDVMAIEKEMVDGMEYASTLILLLKPKPGKKLRKNYVI